MKRKIPAWLVLTIIALAAGLLLGFTNDLTAAPIAEQTLLAAEAARKDVLPGADAFEEQPVADSAVQSCFIGSANGKVVGYTVQVLVSGYGGEIEVTVGISADGTLTGISVGGAKFSETAGLGAKSKEVKFTEQFRGVTPPVVNGENVDGITAATVTTEAVLGAVNSAVEYVNKNF